MKGYLIEITAAAILAALIRKLAPKSGAGRGARLGAGLLVLLCLLQPLGRFYWDGTALFSRDWGQVDPMASDEVSQEANRLMESLITQQAEAYILDKARAMGLKAEVTVTVRLEDRYPVPWAVTIRSDPTGQQKSALETEIQDALGIPPERQEWLQM
jgi:hypothetical protein